MKKKKYLLIAIVLFMLHLTACETAPTRGGEHPVFTSSTDKESCAVCGDDPADNMRFHFGQNNLGIVDLNTFELVAVEINRYVGGRIIEETSCNLFYTTRELGGASITIATDTDHRYSNVTIKSVTGELNTTAIEGLLCQDCLDQFANHYSVGENIASLAVFNFQTQELCPLVYSSHEFTTGDYSVGCSYTDNRIELRLTYDPAYSEQ